MSKLSTGWGLPRGFNVRHPLTPTAKQMLTTSQKAPRCELKWPFLESGEILRAKVRRITSLVPYRHKDVCSQQTRSSIMHVEKLARSHGSKFQKAKWLFKHAHLSIEMEPILQSGAMWMAFSCPEHCSVLTLPCFRYWNLLLLCYLAHNWVFSWGQPPVSQLRRKKRGTQQH